VERGPDWLFLRVERDAAKPGGEPLADHLLGMIRMNHAHRVVLELDRVRSIDDTLINAIAAVGSQVRDDGGLVRVCGLSDGDLRRLRSSDRAGDLPHFESRAAAVGPRSVATS
jgi:MFS superfamily sulfate permease-like transporter